MEYSNPINRGTIMTDDINRYINKVTWGDCLQVMKRLPDKSVDLIVTDPPYGLDKKLSQGSGKMKFLPFRMGYQNEEWDKPINEECFNEMFRISKNQIIFGANYYSMPATRCIIAWDKLQMLPTFSRWEYAWTSFDYPSKLYQFQNGKDHRLHPTQKPLALFEQILQDFSNESDLILDLFAGSFTTAIACIRLKRNFICIEKELRYCKIGLQRIKNEVSQLKLF